MFICNQNGSVDINGESLASPWMLLAPVDVYVLALHLSYQHLNQNLDFIGIPVSVLAEY